MGRCGGSRDLLSATKSFAVVVVSVVCDQLIGPTCFPQISNHTDKHMTVSFSGDVWIIALINE